MNKQNVCDLCKNKEVIVLKRNIYYEVKYNDKYNLNVLQYTLSEIFIFHSTDNFII